MRLLRISFVFCFIAILAEHVEARVFDFKNEHFAMFLGGTFGTSSAGDGAFAWAVPPGIEHDKKVATASSGEFGFMFATSKFNLRLGAEYLMPRDQIGVVATNAAGTELYSLNSTISALIPMANLEFKGSLGARSHGLFGVGYGVAFASISNDYTMTGPGAAALGKGSYKEMASGSAPAMQGYIGWEFVFVDSTTVALTAGYRYIQVPTFKATQDATAISGNETKGNEITNFDGSQRSLNLSGAFGGITLRFFL